MKTIPIPVDVTKLQISVAKAPRPRLVSKETGEIKRNKDGKEMYEVTLLVEDELGRMELVKVSTTPEPPISAGDEVTPVGMIGYVWEITQNGQPRWGISYQAQGFTPVRAAQ
ncbi:hypothetical protein AB0K48_11695 [Nonomuraea sp. NPDC055795]